MTGLVLKPRSPRTGSGIGCLPLLGTPLAGVGLVLIALGLFVQPELGASSLQLGIGATLVAAGLALTVVRVRRSWASAVGVTELTLSGETSLTPGAMVPLRVVHRGPARLSKLSLVLVCERLVKAGSAQHGAVPDMAEGRAEGAASESRPQTGHGNPPRDGGLVVVETPWRVDIFTETDVRLDRRGRLERDVLVTIPGLGKPSGPVLPSGEIRWSFVAQTCTTGGAVADTPFDVVVTLADDGPGAAPAVVAAGGGGETSKGPAVKTADWQSGLGCLAITVAFLLVGPAFVYLYFSDAATKRGNPVMGLVVGVLFTVVGLVAAWIGLAARPKRPKRFGKGDPRRLP